MRRRPAAAAAFAPPALLLLAFSAPCWFSPSPAADAVGGCPLDFSWANFTTAAAACSDGSQRAACCRYINAFVATSIARYANATGRLGVPPAFSEMCLSAVSDTFRLRGIATDAAVFCGLGPKIRVDYQCAGRNTVLEMMQSPSFNDVIGSCRGPLSLDITCKTCLNYGIVYLRRLIGSDDNVALSACRSAVFVTLATQHGVLSYDDILTCFFGVQGITTFPGTVSVTSTPASTPNVTVPSDSLAPKTKSVPLPQKHQKPYHISVVPGIGIGVILLAILLQIVLVVLIRRKNKELRDAELSAQSPDNAFHQGQSWRCAEGQSPMFQRYSYKETTKATNNFSTVIGKGGFGTVYKAQFSDGSIAAVKRMDKVSRQAEEEFCREMELLARLHHRHLVNLKGFCVERKERFLVYEYMENGSLKDHLHSSGTKALSWQTRLQIAMDVANALEYLHFFCNPPLCHRDIKSSNILLDENFVAKVADFGLAHASRTGAISFEAVNTDIRGTPGYMDPEYVVTQELTEKSDIYSYGVVLLELVTGRRAIQDKKNLVEWAQEYMSPSGEIPPELVDPTIRDTVDMDQLHLAVGIVQWCTQREGRQRPSIRQVLRMFSERLDPGNGSFGEGMDDADGGFYPGRSSRGGGAGVHRNELVPCGGDMRSLHSSSSTTRSYCSRSMLLEGGQAHSPPETF
ncbi:probable receptor-like protein kinase At1g49730 [Triticum dicoccoides]|uniref:probable receptor-like protein kinase At1g49730 n=1 Tax=Triticum dicoccoides TaxID=85692 RepID=UPI00188EC2EF|nr:probable receptor-like protein kinase At1g49730 [Triticum dicoccoides]